MSTTTKPPVIISEDSVEDIVQRIVARVKALDESYVPVASDDVHLIAQACADEIVRSQARKNQAAASLLVDYSSGDDLDALVLNLGLKRLSGSKPTAGVMFTLTAVQTVDITIQSGTKLTSPRADIAVLLDDVVIAAGDLSATGTMELDAYVAASDVMTEMFITALPYVGSAKQTSNFDNGAAAESDEALRLRYKVAWEGLSTAGSRAGYIYHTRQADSRIIDVDARSFAAMHVEVVYYAKEYDAVMLERVTQKLNSSGIRPLTDFVTITPAVHVLYDVTAVLHIEEGADAGSVISDASTAVTQGMQLLQKLGQDIPLSKIIALLHVSGVVSVDMTAPVSSQAIAYNEVGVLNSVNLTALEYADA